MIYLVRHGETEFNREHRYQGACDSPLTELGVAQGRALGALLARLIPDAAGWSMAVSPLGRAQRTASLIREQLALPFATDARLSEISLGGWDGMTSEEIAVAYPGRLDGLTRWEWYFNGPGGETYEGLAARLKAWLDETQAAGAPVVAVSHGVSGRMLRGLYAGLGREETLNLEVPQDAVYRLHDGRIERIDAQLLAD